MIKTREKETRKRLRKAFEPPPEQQVSEWVDQFRYNDDGAKFYVSTAEYQRGPLDAISNPDVEEVVIMASVQTMKTEVILNAIGWVAHREPGPIMWTMPGLEMAKNISKARLDPMFQHTPALSSLLSDKRTRDANNSLTFKKFPGGFVILSGANSPASLSSWPIRFAFGDEIDRWGKLIRGEGDILMLFRNRTKKYSANRKIVLVSSPTVRGESRIEPAYRETNQQRYFVPCPHCKEMQPLEFQNLKFEYDKSVINRLIEDAEKSGEEEFEWKKKAIAEHIHAYFVCTHCGATIEHDEKPWMVEHGKWRGKYPGIVKRQGFHIWQAYSPFVSWAETAAEFLYADGYPDRMQVFVNTVLGELYEEKGQRIEDAPLMERRERYPQKLPAKIEVITIGVDVQGDRLEAEVIGWASDGENWSLDYHVLWGNTGLFDKRKIDDDEVYMQLYPLFEREYVREDGVILPVDAIGMDSGFNTENVYDFCEHAGKLYRVFAMKGSSSSLKGALYNLTRAKPRRLKLWIVDGDTAKRVVLDRLGIEPGERGSAHFPDHYRKEYFLGLTAEEKKTRGNVTTWVKVRERNEPVDTRVYAYTALKILSPAWGQIKRRTLQEQMPAPEKKPESVEPEHEHRQRLQVKRTKTLRFGRR